MQGVSRVSRVPQRSTESLCYKEFLEYPEAPHDVNRGLVARVHRYCNITTDGASDAPITKSAGYTRLVSTWDSLIANFKLSHEGHWYVVGQFADVSDARSRLHILLRELALHSTPKPPILSKWTKTAPTIAWFLTAFSLGVVQPLFASDGAFAKFALHPSVSGMEHEMTFHQVQGKYLQRARSVISDNSLHTMMVTLLLLIVMEPVRYLSIWFVSNGTGHWVQSGPDDYPPLLNLVTPRFSPLSAALQYLSSLLLETSAPRRLRLASSLAGLASCRQWFESDSERGPSRNLTQVTSADRLLKSSTVPVET